MTKRQLPYAVPQSKPTNCFAACVATVLEIPIEDVPDCCDGDIALWNWNAFQNWLASRHLQAIDVRFEEGAACIYEVRERVRCIVTGKSPRCKNCETTFYHSVVADFLPGTDGFELLHDPHAEGKWISGSPCSVLFFVPLVIDESSELKKVPVNVKQLCWETDVAEAKAEAFDLLCTIAGNSFSGYFNPQTIIEYQDDIFKRFGSRPF